jgi:hypothetical protein
VSPTIKSAVAARTTRTGRDTSDFFSSSLVEPPTFLSSLIRLISFSLIFVLIPFDSISLIGGIRFFSLLT